MKKTALILLALASALTISSCTAVNVQGEVEPKENEISETDGESATMGGLQIANPIKTYANAEEITAVLGFTVKPLTGAKEIGFSTISNDIAQVKFTFDGLNYSLRADDAEGDFSGIYYTVESEETVLCECEDGSSVSVKVKTFTNNHKILEWANTENTVFYSLYIEGEPSDIAAIIKDAVKSN